MSSSSRRDVLKQTAGLAAVAFGLGATESAFAQAGGEQPRAGGAATPASVSSPQGGYNIVFILTDQERAIQHFPPNWLRQNLPGMRRLRQHGLSFERAFTNACMCSPARSTLMSGYFPAQHGVKYTLEEDMPFPEYPYQRELPRPPELPNLATVMSAAGYNVIYKGKWHCSKPAEKENAKPSDLERYGRLIREAKIKAE